MRRSNLFACVAVLGCSMWMAPAAFADDAQDAPAQDAAKSHADPSSKTLPLSASAKAKQNAFGPKGAAERAAHAVAKSAATDAAKSSGDPAVAAAANASHGKAHAQGPANQAQRGLATAAAARADHAPTPTATHPGR